LLHRLQLDDDETVDQEVQPVATVELHASQAQRQGNLSLKWDSSARELGAEELLIG
jgi:hypothetical protein